MLVDLPWRRALIEDGYRRVECFSQEEVSRAFIDLIRGHPRGWSEFQGKEGPTFS
jgi:hypothetical protein